MATVMPPVGWETDAFDQCTNGGGTTVPQILGNSAGAPSPGPWSAYFLSCQASATNTSSVYIQGVSGTTGGTALASAATLYVRFRFNLRMNAYPTGSEEFFRVDSATPAQKVVFRINTSGNIVAYNSNGTTVIATGTAVIPRNTWVVLQFKVGTGAGGVVEWKINGVTDVSTTASLLTTNSGRIYLGKVNNRNSSTVKFDYDDFIASDSAYPDVNGKVSIMRPSANGTYQQWSIGAGSGSHYQCVDDLGSADAEYLLSPAIALNYDTQYVSDIGDGPLNNIYSKFNIAYQINNITALIMAKRNGASNANVILRFRTGSTDYDLSSGLSVGTGYTAIHRFFDTHPGRSTAWDITDLSDIQVGAGTGTSTQARVNLMFAVVDWSSPDYNYMTNSGILLGGKTNNSGFKFKGRF